MKRFLIIGSIAAGVWVVTFIVFAFSRWLGFDIHIPDWLGLPLYIIVELVAPAALVVAIIGSLVCAIKSELGKRA